MRGIFRIALAMALALGVVAASVFGAADSRILTAPPEQELGAFLNRFSHRRFTPAAAMFGAEVKRRLTGDSLRALHERIVSQTGEITDIETERRWIRDDRALAGGRLVGTRRPIDFDIRMVREQGVWRIADLSPIESALSAP